MKKPEQLGSLPSEIKQLVKITIKEQNIIPKDSAISHYWQTPIANDIFIACHVNYDNNPVYSLRTKNLDPIVLISDKIVDSEGNEITQKNGLLNIKNLILSVRNCLYS